MERTMNKGKPIIQLRIQGLHATNKRQTRAKSEHYNSHHMQQVTGYPCLIFTPLRLESGSAMVVLAGRSWSPDPNFLRPGHRGGKVRLH